MPRLTRPWWLALFLVLPATLGAQGGGRALELHLGRWYNGNRADVYELRTSARLGGPFTHGFGVTALVSDILGRRRAFYGLGYELQAGRGRATLGPYALAGLALGLSTDTSTQEVAALWTVGGGLEWRPLSWLALGGELRYRLEDRGPRGFWNPRPDARDGVSATLGVSFGLGRSAGGRGATGNSAPPDLPPPEPPTTISGNAATVVQTALEALGTPYIWGGTADNGFDCSGLIQYAYEQHGIRLPRVSRDQARAGGEVTPLIDALRPGDILLFSARPGAGVTHVGMYVGELKFIHSSTRGVKLSRLDPQDPEPSSATPLSASPLSATPLSYHAPPPPATSSPPRCAATRSSSRAAILWVRASRRDCGAEGSPCASTSEAGAGRRRTCSRSPSGKPSRRRSPGFWCASPTLAPGQSWPPCRRRSIPWEPRRRTTSGRSWIHSPPRPLDMPRPSGEIPRG